MTKIYPCFQQVLSLFLQCQECINKEEQSELKHCFDDITEWFLAQLTQSNEEDTSGWLSKLIWSQSSPIPVDIAQNDFQIIWDRYFAKSEADQPQEDHEEEIQKLAEDIKKTWEDFQQKYR